MTLTSGTRSLPVWARYLLTLLIVAAAFGLRAGLQGGLPDHNIFLMPILAVLVTATLFDRIRPAGSVLRRRRHPVVPPRAGPGRPAAGTAGRGGLGPVPADRRLHQHAHRRVPHHAAAPPGRA
ncbi:hypothetical protein ACFQY5_13140 [Paeniroseomonas aquatica]|uniref:hypothetical protein n=1 Tax=Paeniroseomonas aquatica TaxID=373043 RepID=UPI00361A09C0